MDVTEVEGAGDGDGLDLTPRPHAPVEVRKRRRWGAIIVLVLVFVAGSVVVTKFLTSAIDYYCNVNEVGVKSGCEAGRRLRIQGTVDKGSVVQAGAVTTFTVSFGGKTLPVRYEGAPGGLFKECIPVVVHGELTDGVFRGDEVEVKHSNEYEAANKGRIDQADSTACSP